MLKTIKTDVVIVGGGVAGLWLLTRLRQLGRAAILVESAALGGGQTICAQGIIHGGMKYALHGNMSTAAQSLSTMPAIWQQCLEGIGEIDLSRVPILSTQQYLWSNDSLTGKLAGFFASMALRGKMIRLQRNAYPAVFQTAQFKGTVYSLAETVIDVPALVRELARLNQGAIFKVNPLTVADILLNSHRQIDGLTLSVDGREPIIIKATNYIFTAGSGNRLVQHAFSEHACAGQRRPLHMVMVQLPFAYSLYAHCLSFDALPRLTITTHKLQNGQFVWYLGGQLAEEGVTRTADEQIACAKKELAELFYWLDFSQAHYVTFHIDRAEAQQEDGKRPDGAVVKRVENAFVAWPTKLAFAPLLAAKILADLPESADELHSELATLVDWPVPVVARPIWETLLGDVFLE